MPLLSCVTCIKILTCSKIKFAYRTYITFHFVTFQKVTQVPYACWICASIGYGISSTNAMVWLGSRVVSMLDSGAEGPGSNRSRDAVG